jgi:Ca2+-binding RTX toxin-like protein
VRLAAFALIVLVIVSAISAFGASISLSSSNVGRESVSVAAEDIKPAACGDLYLTNIVRGYGTITGIPANDLIIGSAGVDTVDGSGGDDCILGGGGDDYLAGSDGNDVCLGGFGNDMFTDCEVEFQ